MSKQIDIYVLSDTNKEYYGHFNSLDNVYKELKAQIDALDFKSHYQRTWTDDEGVITVDYGSHTHFFHITPATMIEWNGS